MMLSLDTAYRSFGGEVEASNTPTICRLPDSRRHQLSAIAQRPIREADIFRVRRYVSKVPISDSSSPLAYCPASTYAALGQTRPGPYRIILGARLTWRSPMPGR